MTQTSPPHVSKYKRKLLARANGGYEAMCEATLISSLLPRLNQRADFTMLPLLMDECVSPNDLKLIKALGYPVLSISDLTMRGTKDDGVFAFAAKNRLGIVTCDKGFVEPTNHDLTKAPAIIYFPPAGRGLAPAVVEQSRAIFGAYFRLLPNMPGRVLVSTRDGQLSDTCYRNNGVISKSTTVNYMAVPRRPLPRNGDAVLQRLKK